MGNWGNQGSRGLLDLRENQESKGNVIKQTVEQSTGVLMRTAE